MFFTAAATWRPPIISKMVASDWSGEDIHVIDRNAEKLERFSKQFGVQVHDKPGSWMAQIDSVVLAVKPQQLPDAIASAKEWMDEALIISIAAGVRIEDLRPCSDRIESAALCPIHR